ncbi:hypothetical protein [Paenibacillus lentus]|uniref:Uncharacterized protein n=1 Tax=Paenibacillus lentus TaxID=1338368 RepID=A0A3S8RPV6_9BACL|nr:hypothetical protein [Paenibacillus lentus]AZK44990.1 hypothetical protein EIM92_01270 [Paenibacillus lentus]
MKKKTWLSVSIIFSIISAIASFQMRLSTFDVRRMELESSIEFDNATALALDAIFFPFMILTIHLVCHIIIVLLSVTSIKYRNNNINFSSIFNFTKNLSINVLMILAAIIAIYFVILSFINPYYPFWSKLVVLITIFVYYIWLLQIIKERTASKA